MDIMINRLLEIETTARVVTEKVSARKEAFTEEMNAKTAVSDKNVEQETAHRIVEIQEEMEADIDGLLAKQGAESEALSKELEDNYNRRHEGYAEALLQEMIKRWDYG